MMKGFVNWSLVFLLLCFSAFSQAEISDKLAKKQKQVRYGLNNDMFSYYDFSAEEYFRLGLYDELSKTMVATQTPYGYVHDVIDGSLKYPHIAVGNGRIVSAGARERTLRISDFDSGKLLFNIKKDHSSRLEDLTIHNEQLIYASDQFVKVRNLNDGKLVRTIKTNINISRLAVYDNQLYLTTGSSRGKHDGGIQIRNLKTGKFIKKIDYKGYRFEDIVIDQENIVAVTYDGHAICIFNRATGKLVHLIKGYSGLVIDLVIDQGKIVAGLSDRKRGRVAVWEISSGKLLNELGNTSVYSVAVNNNQIIAGHTNGEMTIWNLKSGKIENKIKIHSDLIEDLAVFNNSIVSASQDHSVRKVKVPYAGINEEKSKFKTAAIAYFQHTIFEGDEYKQALALPLSDLININSFKQRHSEALLAKNNLKIRQAFKHGKIGERHVPYTSSSYTTHDNDYVVVDGRSITYSTSEDHTSSSGGYDTEVYGYKSIYEVKNNSENYYLIELNSNWTGTYSKYIVRSHGAWSSKSGQYSELKSDQKNSTYLQSFILAPGGKFKYQFELGEEQPTDLITTPLSIVKIEASFHNGLVKAMESSNRDLKLIDQYIESDLVKNWHPQLELNKKRIIRINNDEFSSAHIANAKITLKYSSEDYDPEFDNPVTILIETSEPLKVKFSTPFASKTVNVSKEAPYAVFDAYQTSLTFDVRGVARDKLKGEIEYVWPM